MVNLLYRRLAIGISPTRCACEMRNPSGTQTRSVPYVAGNKPPKGVTGREASTFRKAGRL
jgi:hypothetical protein